MFRVAPDGELTAEWMGAKSTRPNGLVLSPGERILYVSDTTGGLTMAFDTEGKPWGTIEVPDGRVPANCAFGGDDARTLFITAREALYKVALVHPGLY